MMDIWKDRNWTPMLLKQISEPFDSDKHFFEIKFDGIRAIIFASPKEVKIQSRNSKDITHLFPELQDIKNLVKKNVIFDGEIVIFDNGKSSFSKIQERMHLKNDLKIKSASVSNAACYVCFDILYENKDLTSFPLIKRKDILSKYLDTDYFIKTKMVERKGIKLFKEISKLGLEGIVAKLKMGKYYINKRCDEFIKIKNIQDGEYLIGGYEKKKNNILSLAIGYYQGKDFLYAGKVSVRPKTKAHEMVLKQKTASNAFKDFDEDIVYIKPVIKIEVSYLEKTKNGHLRHPIYKELK